MEAAEFYTGIVPDVYRALRASHFSADRYRAFIEEHGQPALELGCGDDGPFFELAVAGYELVGVDSSTDMVDRGLERLRRDGVTAQIHHQRMERLELGMTFGSIYLAGPTFNLLPDDESALDALRAIARHLREDGAALVPLWSPTPTPPERIGVTSVSESATARAKYTVIGETYDLAQRTRTTQVRYELVTDHESQTADREWIIHWFSDDVFRGLAAIAGLRVEFTNRSDDQVDAVLRLA
jgi:ubiquinone/menaquinone biosynthesis C-methylase UbiE